GAGIAAIDRLRVSQQLTHAVGVDEAQLLIEQAADKVAIAVQHIILVVGRRIGEVIFLGVQAFMYLVQKADGCHGCAPYSSNSPSIIPFRYRPGSAIKSSHLARG